MKEKSPSQPEGAMPDAKRSGRGWSRVVTSSALLAYFQPLNAQHCTFVKARAIQDIGSCLRCIQLCCDCTEGS